MKTIDIIHSLAQQLDDPILLNCYTQLKNEQLSFHKSFIGSREKAAAIWGIRLQIAQEHKRHKYTDEEVQYWEAAIEKLDNSKVDDLTITFGKSTTDFFILFWDLDSHELVSRIWLKIRIPNKSDTQNFKL